MHEQQIKKRISECFRKGKRDFPKCDFVVFANKRKNSDEVSNKYGRFDIVGFSRTTDTYYLVETKDIGKDNKRLVSLGQVFGQASAYRVAIEADPLGFKDSCMDKFGPEYSKYLARFPQKKIKLKVFIGVDEKDEVRLEFLERLRALFRNKVGTIIVNKCYAKLVYNPKDAIPLNSEPRPIQLLKIFGDSEPRVKKLANDLAKEILRLGPTVCERERTDRWSACAKSNFVEFFKRKNGILIQYHISGRKKFDGKVKYTNFNQNKDVLKKIRKSLSYCQ